MTETDSRKEDKKWVVGEAFGFKGGWAGGMVWLFQQMAKIQEWVVVSVKRGK